MAAQNIDKLFEKYLGKEAAGQLTSRIDQMVRAKAKPAAIEQAALEGISDHIQKATIKAVLLKIGPSTPIKVTPLSVSIKPSIKPIIISPKISTGVQVKVSPATLVQVGPGSRGRR